MNHEQEKYLLQITKAFKRRRNQHQENGEGQKMRNADK
jgi:hypothetical protein